MGRPGGSAARRAFSALTKMELNALAWALSDWMYRQTLNMADSAAEGPAACPGAEAGAPGVSWGPAGGGSAHGSSLSLCAARAMTSVNSSKLRRPSPLASNRRPNALASSRVNPIPNVLKLSISWGMGTPWDWPLVLVKPWALSSLACLTKRSDTATAILESSRMNLMTLASATFAKAASPGSPAPPNTPHSCEWRGVGTPPRLFSTSSSSNTSLCASPFWDRSSRTSSRSDRSNASASAAMATSGSPASPVETGAPSAPSKSRPPSNCRSSDSARFKTSIHSSMSSSLTARSSMTPPVANATSKRFSSWP
mmetsp:Transcript_11792/g.27619  ORF Transcript_11792/g.27619 Transcript_11792/m.27619 type:complete len:311 (-) Transcript_11792:193-1125(-)